MDETRVAMRRRRQLNHTQRRVAAVSFLSNVACGDSKAPRLDCLQNTEVLESYRRSRSKRQAGRKEEAVQTKPRSAPNSGSRERTPEQRGFREENLSARKLSCRQPQDGQMQRKRMIYQSQWSEDGTLDSTNNSTPSHPIARWHYQLIILIWACEVNCCIHFAMFAYTNWWPQLLIPPPC